MRGAVGIPPLSTDASHRCSECLDMLQQLSPNCFPPTPHTYTWKWETVRKVLVTVFCVCPGPTLSNVVQPGLEKVLKEGYPHSSQSETISVYLW